MIITITTRDGMRRKRGGALAGAARSLRERGRGRVTGVVVSYKGGSFSEMRGAAAVASTLGFIFGVPVKGRRPVYNREPNITKSTKGRTG